MIFCDFKCIYFGVVAKILVVDQGLSDDSSPMKILKLLGRKTTNYASNRFYRIWSLRPVTERIQSASSPWCEMRGQGPKATNLLATTYYACGLRVFWGWILASLRLSVSLSVYLSICLSVSQSVSQSVSVSVCLSVCQSVSLSWFPESMSHMTIFWSCHYSFNMLGHWQTWLLLLWMSSIYSMDSDPAKFALPSRVKCF